MNDLFLSLRPMKFGVNFTLCVDKNNKVNKEQHIKSLAFFPKAEVTPLCCDVIVRAIFSVYPGTLSPLSLSDVIVIQTKEKEI